jgi:hypothetical protein
VSPVKLDDAAYYRECSSLYLSTGADSIGFGTFFLLELAWILVGGIVHRGAVLLAFKAQAYDLPSYAWDHGTENGIMYAVISSFAASGCLIWGVSVTRGLCICAGNVSKPVRDRSAPLCLECWATKLVCA